MSDSTCGLRKINVMHSNLQKYLIQSDRVESEDIVIPGPPEGPSAPRGPSGPLGPSIPAGPGSPLSPGPPSSPLLPGTVRSNQKPWIMCQEDNEHI